MPLEFAKTADAEHQNILRARRQTDEAAWELGTRLLRFKQTFGWQKVTQPSTGAPFKDWTDYLRRGVQVGVSTAFKYMDIACFPLSLTLELGLERTYWLKQCTDLTAVDETAEQALALELPTADGKTKPVRQMTAEEAEQAYRLMRDEGRPVERPARPQGTGGAPPPMLTEEVTRWFGANRLRPHVDDKGTPLIDVLDVPVTAASDIFSMLATTYGLVRG
ncbi:MAG: hypothetical protein HY901_09435 [Deltaproteobacteria bacterium]|nr:hypothetical protein [Deltaproteobacteria bacterium]